MGDPALKPDEHFTFKDYKTWPEGELWELIDGVAMAMNTPRIPHQRLVTSLTAQLVDWFKDKPCEPFVAPLGVLLPDHIDQDEDDIDTIVIPDLLVVCDPQKIHDDGIHGAPDWVLEVLSPSTMWHDQTTKRRLYEEHGVKEYWIVNPDTLDLTIFRLVNGKYSGPVGANLRDPVPVKIFPGLQLHQP